MENTPFEVFAGMALCAALAFGMVRLALHKHALERRQPPRRCPSCGVLRNRRGPCRCSAS